MFHSSCEENCSLEIKCYHKCRNGLKQNVTKSATSVDRGSEKDENVVMQAIPVMAIEPQGF